MKTELKIINVGGNRGIIIPKLYSEHIGIEIGDKIEIQDDEGKHGKYLSFWKKGD